MNKKILLGSIIAVVILVLVSFTSVVGYQTTKSSTIARASPLFSVRTQRAIDKDSRDIACNYVGKGEEINIPLPTRNNRSELFDRCVDIIRKMDDKSYDRFVDLILKYLYTRDDFQEYQKEELILSFNNIRNNPNKTTPYIQDGEESNLLHSYYCTFTFPGCPTPSIKEYGMLLCTLFYLLVIILLLIVS